jgi:DNA segregation ATPase FtsK/SpoIIIE-like protein
VASAGEAKIIRQRVRRAWRGRRQRYVVIYVLVTAAAWGYFGAADACVIISTIGLAAVCVPSFRSRLTAFINTEAAVRNNQMLLLVAMGMNAPTLLEVNRTEVGEDLLVQTSAGTDRELIERSSSAIAAALHAQVVRVRPVAKDAALARLVVVRRDRLESSTGLQDFLAVLPRTSLHHPVPLGYDEDGAVVSVPLLGHHLLVGGEPGSGKSVSVSVLLASAAFDPEIELWLFDAKLVELSLWRDIATRFLGPDIAEASAALDELIEEMARRYERLEARKARKVVLGDGERLIMVVIDELAFYVAHHDKKAGAGFADRLRDLVARARAAGIIVVAATQKPSTDLVPSALRDNFGFRLAHRCATRDASDTILGSGWASEGYSASSIDPAMRGVGYLLADGGIPRRMRSFSLTDFDVAEIVRHGAALRRGNQS